MAELILHHYPQSPVAEKVRVGLGIKDLTWRSVIIPRLPPKSDLMPLTGGYRRTPVLQIGADIYCDSQCILRELERRFPEPSFYPDGADGMVWGVSRWTDGDLFSQAVALVLSTDVEDLPPAFARDRGRLYFGPNHDLKEMAKERPHILAQLRGQFGWVEQRLATGRSFILGETPALPDALAYYTIWFLRGRWAGGPDFLSQFPNLLAWESRVAALGHGEDSEMDSKEALALARAAEPGTPEASDPQDPQGLLPGQEVSVVPDCDGGDPEVIGKIRALDAERIAILREDPRAGLLCLHFPRVGYRVTVL